MGVKTLTHRQVLVELLRTHHDALVDWDPRSNGDGVRLMPSLYHQGSYAELERRLTQMRDSNWRTPWWHLSHRYRWGDIRWEIVPCKRTRQGPIPRLRHNTELVSAGEVHGQRMACLVYEWRADVNPHQVDRALDRLLELMHNGQPWRIRLPQTVFQHAIGIAPTEQPARRQPPTTTSAPADTLLAVTGSSAPQT